SIHSNIVPIASSNDAAVTIIEIIIDDQQAGGTFLRNGGPTISVGAIAIEDTVTHDTARRTIGINQAVVEHKPLAGGSAFHDPIAQATEVEGPARPGARTSVDRDHAIGPQHDVGPTADAGAAELVGPRCKHERAAWWDHIELGLDVVARTRT